jgi:hypothetical protein
MEPLARAKRLSGDQRGSPGSKVITSEVPDKPKRTSVKGNVKPMTTAHESDFTNELNEFKNNPVDTDPLGLDAQAYDLQRKETNTIKKKDESPDSLTTGIHEAKEILNLINLIKPTGQQDADGLWHPIPASDFPWSSRLVER